MRFGLVMACTCLAPTLAAAAEPVRLQPSSPWIVDYAENSCRLVRTFTADKNLVRLAFESDAPGEMDMLAVGKPLQTFEQQVAARFLPVGGKTFDGNVAETVTNRDPAILWGNVQMLSDQATGQLERAERERQTPSGVRPPPISLAEQEFYKAQRQAFAASVTELEIQTRRNRPVILETGALAKPMTVFDQCGRDSLKDWGIDPNVEDKIVRPVWATNPGQWLSADDYPAEMVRKGKESQIAVRLLIDASGNVTKCTALTDYEEKEFNQITCAAIMKRARFAPAELADGTRLPSYYTRRVVFRMAS